MTVEPLPAPSRVDASASHVATPAWLRPVWWALMLFVSAGLVSSLWAVPYLPTNDGPQHVLSGYIENHFDDVGAPYRGYLALLPQFAARGFAMLFLPLEVAFGWRVGLKLAESAMAVANLWGFAVLVLALERRSSPIPSIRRFTALLGAVVALPWVFYMGFFPGVVAWGFGLFVLGFALWSPTWTLARRFVVGAMLTLQAVMHVFTAGVTGVLLLALGLALAARDKRLREAALTVATGVPAGFVFLLTLLDRGKLAEVAASHDTAWDPLADRLAYLAGTLCPGTRIRSFLALGLGVAACGMTLVRARPSRAAGPQRVDRADVLLAVIAPAFILLSLVLPRDVPGWQFFSPRLAGMGLTLGLALVDTSALACLVGARGAALLSAVLAAGSLVATMRLNRTLATGCADLVSGLGRDLPRGGFLLPLVLNPICSGLKANGLARAVPHLQTALHIGALYAVESGAAQPYLFMGVPSAHALGLSPHPRSPLAPSARTCNQPDGPPLGPRRLRTRPRPRRVSASRDGVRQPFSVRRPPQQRRPPHRARLRLPVERGSAVPWAIPVVRKRHRDSGNGWRSAGALRASGAAPRGGRGSKDASSVPRDAPSATSRWTVWSRPVARRLGSRRLTHRYPERRAVRGR